MSATATLAPARANASAVVRPIPLPPPVTNATRPSNLYVAFIVLLVRASLVFAAAAEQVSAQAMINRGFVDHRRSRTQATPLLRYCAGCCVLAGNRARP